MTETASATFTRSPIGGTFTVEAHGETFAGRPHGEAWHLLTEGLGFSAQIADRTLAEAKVTGAEVLAVFPITDPETPGKAIVVRQADPDGLAPGAPVTWVVAEVAPGREDLILGSNELSASAVAMAIEVAGLMTYTPTTETETMRDHMTDHDPFTVQHCTAWCDSVGIDQDYIAPMVQALADDGPDSTMSWPTIARSVGATFTDGIEYC